MKRKQERKRKEQKILNAQGDDKLDEMQEYEEIKTEKPESET